MEAAGRERQGLSTTCCRNPHRFHQGRDRALDKVSPTIAIEKWLKPVRNCHTNCYRTRDANSFGEEHGIDPALILATSHGRRTIDIVHQWKPELANMECKSWPNFVTVSQPQPRSPRRKPFFMSHEARNVGRPEIRRESPGFEGSKTHDTNYRAGLS